MSAQSPDSEPNKEESEQNPSVAAAPSSVEETIQINTVAKSSDIDTFPDPIAFNQSVTANHIAVSMVWAVLSSIIIVFVAYAFLMFATVFVKLFSGSTSDAEKIGKLSLDLFDKWIAVVGPLLGTVIGFYFGTRSGKPIN